MFVISHTIHHNALIARLLDERAISMDPRFGLAPAHTGPCMCTVTILPASFVSAVKADAEDPLRWRLVCNRDELMTRPAALPPALTRAGSRLAIMPVIRRVAARGSASMSAGLALFAPERLQRVAGDASASEPRHDHPASPALCGHRLGLDVGFSVGPRSFPAVPAPHRRWPRACRVLLGQTRPASSPAATSRRGDTNVIGPRRSARRTAACSRCFDNSSLPRATKSQPRICFTCISGEAAKRSACVCVEPTHAR